MDELLNGQDVVYLAVSECHSKELAEMHRQKRRDLELQLCETLNHIMEHEGKPAEEVDVDKAKYWHDKLEDIENQLAAEIDHRNKWKQHFMGMHNEHVWKVQVKKDFVDSDAE